MARRITTDKIDETKVRSESILDKLVDLRPDAETKKTRKTIRLIGLPIAYYEASQYKVDPNDKKKSVEVPFPDAAINKWKTRICEDDLENDFWAQNGYKVSQKYAMNCLERNGDEPPKVKILNKGKSIFKELRQEEKNNEELNQEYDEDEKLWTMVGGPDAPDIKIVATKDPGAFGGVEYNLVFAKKPAPITDEEVEILRAAGCPTDEELKKLRKENPDLADMPDWFFYGYKLEELFKPTPLRTQSSTKSEELDVAEDFDDPFSDEDEEKDAAPAKAKKDKVKKEKETPAPADDEEETKSTDDDEEDSLDNVDWGDE